MLLQGQLVGQSSYRFTQASRYQGHGARHCLGWSIGKDHFSATTIQKLVLHLPPSN